MGGLFITTTTSGRMPEHLIATGGKSRGSER
jgi:hypothetical protein